ncbi:MAG: carbon-phosphorus lyase complex subunit PhnI [Rhizobiales bacterium 32-66-8]|nr:MAG: carbon-phosphorus lyase complex subunit PhnI [Rhizobiales bacterium 32-66-8]
MYVAVKGGETAIRNAHALLAETRRGDPAVPEIGIDQISEQLALAVDRVMAEGSLYDRRLAALALKQARGDMIEAIFLVRAFRTTLPRFGASLPVDTGAMQVRRRISATFKDLPGGQVLGPTFDYTHRLLDPTLATEAASPAPPSSAGAATRKPADAGKKAAPPPASAPPMARVTDLLAGEGLIEAAPADTGEAPEDLTRTPLSFPADRAVRLQNLARGDEGFLLALGYSTQRGYARTHPFVGEVRMGDVEVEMFVEELGFSVSLGDITLTECQMVNQFHGSAQVPPQFTRGYGLVFGQSERKAMSMALVDRALRWEELGEEKTAPAQDAEFVLSHSDNVQATGFVEHLKLPHYVDFQAELDLVRRMRAEHTAQASRAEDETDPPLRVKEVAP